MSTIHTPDRTSDTFQRGAKPTSIGKLFTLAAAGAIGVGAMLGLAVFESSGTASGAPAAAIVVPAYSASLDAHAFGIVAPGFIAPTRCAMPGDADPQPGQDGGLYGPSVWNDGCGGNGTGIRPGGNPPPPPGKKPVLTFQP